MRKCGMILAVGILLTASFASCEKRELMAYDSFYYFGSQMRWVFRPDGNEERTWRKITARAEEIENSVSAVKENSSVARFNRAEAGETVEIDGVAYELIQRAKEIYEKSGGAYNPAVGGLVELWGLSAGHSGETPKTLPGESTVQALLSLTDFSAVEAYEISGKYYAVKPEEKAELDGVTYTMKLDFGGIGKGYCVDEAERLIRADGYTEGYFNLGGSSMCVFKNPSDQNGIWEIGVVDPRGAGNFMSVREADKSLSSSGDYMNYYKLDGLRYCHIIDPETGYPVNVKSGGKGMVAASVFGLTALEGDAVTTALIAMGREKAISFIQDELSGKDVLFVYYDGDFTLYTTIAEENMVMAKQMRVEQI